MTIKKARTPQAVKQLKSHNKTPDSAPSKLSFTPTEGRRTRKSFATPAAAKEEQDIVPKKLISPKGTPSLKVKGTPVQDIQKNTPVQKMANGEQGKTPVQKTPKGTSMQKTPKGTSMQKTPKGTPKQETPKGTPMPKSPKGTPMPKSPKGTPMPKTPKGTPMPKTPKGTPMPKTPKGKPVSVKKPTPKKAQKMNEEEDDEEFVTGDEDDGDDDLDMSDDDDLSHDSDSEEEVPNPVLAKGKAGKEKLDLDTSDDDLSHDSDSEEEVPNSVHAKGKAGKGKLTGDIDPYRLYVSGFGQDVTSEDLMELFPKANDIALVPIRPSEKQRVAYGFVTYEDRHLAKAAQENVQGTMFRSHVITVMFAKPRKERPLKGIKSETKKGAEGVKQKRKLDLDPKTAKMLVDELKHDEERKADRDRRVLFVNNLPDNTTEDMLMSLADGIEEVRLKYIYRRSKRVPSYAYLVFETEVLAKKQFKKLSSTKLGEKEIHVDFVGEKSRNKEEHKAVKQLKPSDIDPYRLYITGFGQDVKAKDLKELFPEACDISLPIRASDKQSVGYGFVEYTDRQLAQDAHENLQGKMFRSHAITIMFAKRRKERPLKAHKRKNEQEKKVEETKSGASAAKKAKKDKKTKTKKPSELLSKMATDDLLDDDESDDEDFEMGDSDELDNDMMDSDDNDDSDDNAE